MTENRKIASLTPFSVFGLAATVFLRSFRQSDHRPGKYLERRDADLELWCGPNHQSFDCAGGIHDGL